LKGFSRDIIAAALAHEVFDRRNVDPRRKTADRQHEFGRSNVAQHFQLPIIRLALVTAPISHFVSPVRKQQVRQLMRYREAHTLSGLLRIEFDNGTTV